MTLERSPLPSRSMTDRATPVPVVREPDSSAPSRRTDERRTVESAGRRHKPPSRWIRYLGITGRDLLVAVFAIAAIFFAVSHIHPIFANSPPVAQVLTERSPIAPVAKAVLAPTPKDTSEIARLVSSPQFKQDSAAFAEDLVRTGRMSQARADSI